MNRKKSFGERAFDIANVSILTLLCFCTLYPILYIIFGSLSDSVLLVRHSGFLYKPVGFSWDAYSMVLKNPMIGIGYRNTLFILVVGTFINVALTSLGAYCLSRRNVLFTKPILMMIVFTMFFNGGLIPTFMVVKNLHMVDTLWSVIIPTAISAYNLIVMRTFFLSLPDSLEESAKMDGANEYTVLFRIVLPLSMPVVAVMILFYAVGHWNAFLNALIYLNDRDKFPLQLVLREILIQNSTDNMTTDTASLDAAAVAQSIKYSTIVIATVPILFIYPFLQRYFTKGVLIGAIKE
ncbi:carbohydrate ABC transporter permease [Cohnella fermenti]|uniref:Carbohydrate ABC transporter permease n=1 Tax=Cohnella fermenti TaxID=2565925 RepID=A0A4S4BPP0_9BACL|nr:carbohydrate ABC transporter permease [Cohnella fermenti]THF76716.1 carbohydrate ABC transporter permease [Cohnella fermenti]